MPESDIHNVQHNIDNAPIIQQDDFNRLPYGEQNVRFRDMVAQLVERVLDTPEGKIIISAHTNPDPDAFCSAVAMQQLLQTAHPGKEDRIIVVFSDTKNSTLSDLAPHAAVVWAKDQTNGQTDVSAYIHPGDCLIMTDANELHQISPKKSNTPATQRLTRIILDHHPQQHHDSQLTPVGTNISLIRAEASSASELVAIVGTDNIAEISPQTAKLLLMGIIGDTRGFEFIKKQPGQEIQTLDLVNQLFQKSGAESIESLLFEVFKMTPLTLELITLQYRHLSICQDPENAIPVTVFTGSTADELPSTSETKSELQAARRQVTHDTGYAAPLRINVQRLPDGTYDVMFRSRGFNILPIARQLFNARGLPTACSGKMVIDIPDSESQNSGSELTHIYTLIMDRLKTVEWLQNPSRT